MGSCIVDIETKDELSLYGLLSESNKNTIIINIHGTASNFYADYFTNKLAEVMNKNEISFLSTNNRGLLYCRPIPLVVQPWSILKIVS